MLIEIKIAIVIISALIAAYTDYKKGYIYDWLNWPFIVIGAILAFFSPNVLWAFVQFVIVFGIGYIFYRFGKIGGGDIKFFSGLALYFPFYNNMPFLLIVLVLSSLLAILFYGLYYLVLLLRRPTKEVWYSTIISFVLALILGGLFLIFSLWYLALIIFVFSFFAFTSLLLKDTIMQKFYKKEISIAKLLNDDLVDMKSLSNKYVKVGKISAIEMYPLEQKQYLQLKKLLPKNAKLFVYRNLPVFGPFIALGIIASFILLEFVNLGFLI